MLIAFAVILGPLIFIHELGHFAVAKWLGIRVEVFSLGFGKRIWGFKRGDTDYRLSALPLGGYVKMAGENIGDERMGAPDEFLSHPKWHRFLVAVAGPVMNIIVALLIPAMMAMVSIKALEYKEQAPVVAGTLAHTGAAAAGLQPGDRIVRVDGDEVRTWSDVDDHVLINAGQVINVTAQRGGQTVDAPVTLDTFHYNGEKIGFLGVVPDTLGARIEVAQVVPGEPAEAAGLQKGDEIVAINGTKLGGYTDGLVWAINASANEQVAIQVKRGDELLDLAVTPVVREGVGRIGFAPQALGHKVTEARLGPVAAVQHAWSYNLRIVKMTGEGIGQIFTGERSAGETVAGPIRIAEISGQAAELGAEAMLNLMAMLSLNLGIFNLLPIPVLDGGLIFLLFLEALFGLFGFRLSTAVKERMVNVGFVMIVLLMGYVIFNDVARKFVRPSVDTPARAVERQAPEPAK
jgi:regulator of sigma E protease